MRNYITRILLCVALLAGTTAAWATDYVITYTSSGTTHYLSNSSGSIADATTFDPSTCIWTCSGTTSGTLVNNGTYLYFNDSDLTTTTSSSTATSWTITDGGNIYYPRQYFSINYYIAYNSSWDAYSSSYFSSYRATIYSVATETHNADSNLDVTYNQKGDTGFERWGDSRDYYTENLSYTPAYKKYTWNSNTYYASADDSYVTTEGAPTAVTTASSYAWTSSHPDNVTVTQDEGNPDEATAEYVNKFSTETTVTITATATISKSNSPFMTEDATVNAVATATLLSRNRQNLSLEIGSSTLYVGETTTITDKSGHDGTISYTVSDPSIATITADGTLTAVGTGSANAANVVVTVSRAQSETYEAASAQATITVNKRPTTLALAYDKSNLTYGDAAPALTQCVVTDTSKNEELSGAAVTYTSSSNAVTVDANGALTINYGGDAVITATYAGDGTYAGSSATFTVSVSKATPTLTFPAESYFALFTEGLSDAPEAELTPEDAGTVTYSCVSSPEGLVTVDANTGTITFADVDGVMEGEATITATFAGNDKYNAATASYVLTVSTRDIPDFSVDMNNDLYVDDTSQMTVDKGGSTGALTYSSSNTDIVTVSPDGLMTAVAEGTAEVTISMEGDTKYIPMSVTFTVSVRRIPTQLTLTYLEHTYYTDHTGDIIPAVQLIETVNNSGVSGMSYTFTSSDTNVLTVDENTGYITIVGEGSSYVVASFAGTNKYEGTSGYFLVNIKRVAMPGDFIRLKDTSGNYLSSDGTTVTCTSSTADASNIIYFGEGKSLLFYQCGLYLKDATAALSDPVDVGGKGTPFIFTRNGDVYTISDGSNNMISGGNTAWTIEEVSTLPVTFKDAGYGYSTFFCPVDVLRPSGVLCYYPVERTSADDTDYTITLRTITDGYIPKNTPVIMQTEDINTYNFTITSGVAQLTDVATFMTGTVPAINTASVYNGTQWPYTLQPNSAAATVGFYPWKSDKHTTIEPFRCYIPGAKASAQAAFRFVFAGDATGISTVTESATTADDTIYNLQGMAVGTNLKALPAGIYIRGGKKIVVK